MNVMYIWEFRDSPWEICKCTEWQYCQGGRTKYQNIVGKYSNMSMVCQIFSCQWNQTQYCIDCTLVITLGGWNWMIAFSYLQADWFSYTVLKRQNLALKSWNYLLALHAMAKLEKLQIFVMLVFSYFPLLFSDQLCKIPHLQILFACNLKIIPKLWIFHAFISIPTQLVTFPLVQPN